MCDSRARAMRRRANPPSRHGRRRWPSRCLGGAADLIDALRTADGSPWYGADMGIAELITQAAADRGAIHGVADGCHAERYVGGRAVAHERIAVSRSSLTQIAGNRPAGGHWEGQFLHAFALASAERKRTVAPVDQLQCQVSHFIVTQAEVKQVACDGVIMQFDRI